MGWGIFVTQTQKNNPLKFVIIQASWLCNALSSQQADVHYEEKFWGNQSGLLIIIYFIHSLFILIVHYKSLIKFSTQQAHSWGYTYHNITMVWYIGYILANSYIIIPSSKIKITPFYYAHQSISAVCKKINLFQRSYLKFKWAYFLTRLASKI